jgi:hypothetical protein
MAGDRYDPDDEWHSSVDLMLTVDCDTCHAQFISPTLGNQVATGDDAALVAREAREAGWQLFAFCCFRCPRCHADQKK